MISHQHHLFRSTHDRDDTLWFGRLCRLIDEDLTKSACMTCDEHATHTKSHHHITSARAPHRLAHVPTHRKLFNRGSPVPTHVQQITSAFCRIARSAVRRSVRYRFSSFALSSPDISCEGGHGTWTCHTSVSCCSPMRMPMPTPMPMHMPMPMLVTRTSHMPIPMSHAHVTSHMPMPMPMPVPMPMSHAHVI